MPLTTAVSRASSPQTPVPRPGLVNVTQQVGAALGLAVLVTVLSATAGHAQLKAGVTTTTTLVHGLDMTFGVAALFGLAALAMVASLVHLPAGARNAEAIRVVGQADESELVDGEGFEWSDPELVA